MRVERRGATTAVEIRGEIDLSNATAVRRRIDAEIDAQTADVVVDLTQVSYLDSQGVRLLRELAQRRPVAVVVANDSAIREILAVTKLDESISVRAPAS